MKVLVTGSNGLVGSPFKELLGDGHIYHTRQDVDLTDEKLTKEYITYQNPKKNKATINKKISSPPQVTKWDRPILYYISNFIWSAEKMYGEKNCKVHSMVHQNHLRAGMAAPHLSV